MFMHAPPGVTCSSSLDGLTIVLPPPQTSIRRLARFSMVLVLGLGGFLLGAAACTLISFGTMGQFFPMLLPLLGFAGMGMGLKLSDAISKAIFPMLSPVQLQLRHDALHITHSQNTTEVKLRDVQGLDPSRERLLTRSGRWVTIAPGQSKEIVAWVLTEITQWLNQNLQDAGNAQDIPAAMRAIKALSIS